MKKEIINLLTWYANRISETTTYKTWSDEFCRKEVRTATMDFLGELRKHIDLTKLTREEAVELGFGKWEENGDLYLIPLYLLPIIPVGTELTSIFGNKVVYNGHNIDTDIRCGCLAFGIHIPETEQEKRYVYELRYDDDWEEAHFMFGLFDSEDKAKAEMEDRLEDFDDEVVRAEKRKHYSISKIEVK